MMKSAFLLIILSLLFVGCNSDEPKLAALGNINSNSTSAPYITNVTVPAFGIYVAASTMDFYVTFSKSVSVTGTPRVSFVADTGAVVANYVDGSGTNVLHFSAIVPAGVIDDNGITLSQLINTNGGSIVDSDNGETAFLNFTPPATWGIMINAGDPMITSITPPADGTYTTGQTVRFIVNFNARVCGANTPRLPLNVGGSTKYAVWVNESCRTSMKFDYVVTLGDMDADGIQLTGPAIDLTFIGSYLKDSFNDNATLGYMTTIYSGVLVSGVAVPPVIASKTVPADKTYKLGENLDFVINYNEPVFVSGGTPDVHIDIGGNVRSAFLVSGSGTSTLTFRYTIASNDEDTDGIAISGFQYNGSAIKNASNANSPAPGAWASLTNVKADGIVPSEVSRSDPADGLRTVGQTVEYYVTFNEPVTVTGTPRYQIILTTGTVYANYVSGSGTTNLVFHYVVQEGDEDLNGIATNASMDLNGGTIKDAAGNAKGPVVVAWPAHSVYVDAKNPSIVSANFVAPGAFKQGETAYLQILWSEPITYSGTATVNYSVDSGGTVTFTEYNKAATQIDLSYTVGASKLDYDGITPGSFAGVTVTDGIGRSPSSLAVPAPNKKIYFVPTEISKWWDTSDTITIGGSGATLIQFRDIYAGTAGGITGTINLLTSSYRPPLKYASFTGTQKATFSTNSLNYFVAVIDTTGSPSGPLLETDSGTPSPYLVMNSGVIEAPACTIVGCYYRDASGTWVPVNIVTKLMMGYSTNTIQIIAVRFPSSTNNYRIGSTFVGGFHEAFFINATVNSESVITNLIQHLETKYGVTY